MDILFLRGWTHYCTLLDNPKSVRYSFSNVIWMILHIEVYPWVPSCSSTCAWASHTAGIHSLYSMHSHLLWYPTSMDILKCKFIIWFLKFFLLSPFLVYLAKSFGDGFGPLVKQTPFAAGFGFFGFFFGFFFESTSITRRTRHTRSRMLVHLIL